MTLPHRASPFFAPSMAWLGAATRAAVAASRAAVSSRSRSHFLLSTRNIPSPPWGEPMRQGKRTCLSRLRRV